MSKVHIPVAMRAFADRQKSVDVPGDTVSALLDELVAKFPALGLQLRGGDGAIKPYVAVFVNDTDIRDLAGPATPVGERDEVQIVSAIAGG